MDVNWLVDRMLVSTPMPQIEKVVRDRIERARKRGSPISRGEEKALLRQARLRHKTNQGTVSAWQL